MPKGSQITKAIQKLDRMKFIGGSDARIIMGKDEKALHRLWREKRGEEAPPDLSGVLIVQLGIATEDLNRRWYELNSGQRVSDIQRHAIHCTMPWMAATLDGLVKETGAVFEAKFMLPWSFSGATPPATFRKSRSSRRRSGSDGGWQFGLRTFFAERTQFDCHFEIAAAFAKASCGQPSTLLRGIAGEWRA